MKVKHLIAFLQKLDPEMRVGRREACGSFIPLAKEAITCIRVMKAKSDPTYAAWVDDPVWKHKRNEFEKPFPILLID